MFQFALRVAWVFVACLYAAGCGEKPTTLEDFRSTEVTLPDGQVIMAEVMRNEKDMYRGMMFRDELKPNRGMLFIHGSEGPYKYWMYQVRIPLDIIWLSSSRRVVEIAANAQPCKTNANDCPQYGGNAPAQFILELPGGAAGKHGLKTGDVVSF